MDKSALVRMCAFRLDPERAEVIMSRYIALGLVWHHAIDGIHALTLHAICLDS